MRSQYQISLKSIHPKANNRPVCTDQRNKNKKTRGKCRGFLNILNQPRLILLICTRIVIVVITDSNRNYTTD